MREWPHRFQWGHPEAIIERAAMPGQSRSFPTPGGGLAPYSLNSPMSF